MKCTNVRRSNLGVESSVAPDGACFVSVTFPTAEAVGYFLPPLRGCFKAGQGEGNL